MNQKSTLNNPSKGNAFFLLLIAIAQCWLVYYEITVEEQYLWASIFGLMAFLTLCASIFECRGRI